MNSNSPVEPSKIEEVKHYKGKRQAGLINVSSNYTFLLTMYALTFGIDTVRELIGGFHFHMEGRFAKALGYLNANSILQMMVFVLNHVYRFRHAGSVCAGDKINEDLTEE